MGICVRCAQALHPGLGGPAGRRAVREQRIPHGRGPSAISRAGEHGSPVAVETIGNWYWIRLRFASVSLGVRRPSGCLAIVDGLRKVNQRLPAHVPDALILYFARCLFKTRAHQTEASIHPVTLLAGRRLSCCGGPGALQAEGQRRACGGVRCRQPLAQPISSARAPPPAQRRAEGPLRRGLRLSRPTKR
jgi:hypothetical protein